MTKSLYRLLAIFVFSVALLCCSISKTDMQRMIKSRIYIPRTMPSICDGMISDYADISGKVKLVYYNSSDVCTYCNINRLYRLEPLYNLYDNKLFSIFIIFAPQKGEYEKVISFLQDSDFKHQVLVDKNRKFIAKNNFIPDNAIYHCFLMDKNDEIVLVGDPVASDAMWNLFKATLDNMLAHDGVYVPDEKN